MCSRETLRDVQLFLTLTAVVFVVTLFSGSYCNMLHADADLCQTLNICDPLGVCDIPHRVAIAGSVVLDKFAGIAAVFGESQSFTRTDAPGMIGQISEIPELAQDAGRTQQALQELVKVETNFVDEFFVTVDANAQTLNKLLEEMEVFMEGENTVKALEKINARIRGGLLEVNDHYDLLISHVLLYQDKHSSFYTQFQKLTTRADARGAHYLHQHVKILEVERPFDFMPVASSSLLTTVSSYVWVAAKFKLGLTALPITGGVMLAYTTVKSVHWWHQKGRQATMLELKKSRKLQIELPKLLRQMREFAVILKREAMSLQKLSRQLRVSKKHVDPLMSVWVRSVHKFNIWWHVKDGLRTALEDMKHVRNFLRGLEFIDQQQ